MIPALRKFIDAIRNVFPVFVQRAARIAHLESELKGLKIAQKTDEKQLEDAVSQTGPVVFAEHVLEVTQDEKVTKTAIGSKELLEGVAKYDPLIGARVELVAKRLEKDKAEANKANAKTITEFKYRKADAGDLRGSPLWTVR